MTVTCGRAVFVAACGAITHETSTRSLALALAGAVLAVGAAAIISLSTRRPR